MTDQDSGIVIVDQEGPEAAPSPAQVPETNDNATAPKPDEEAEPKVDPAALKKLKIRTGVVQRLIKDKAMYQKEIVDQEKKIEEYFAEGKDESFMRQQTNCLNESKMMIPNVQKRLLAACVELKEVLDTEQSSPISKTKEYKDATTLLAQGQASAAEK